MDLEAWSARLKVLADATRVRLLALLEHEELTVAELSSITRLAQPRVSTHLARLKEAGLVRDRRAGVSAYYRFNGIKSGVSTALLQGPVGDMASGADMKFANTGWPIGLPVSIKRLHFYPPQFNN